MLADVQDAPPRSSPIVAGENLAIYCASKVGVVQLTKALACDRTPEGIRVNRVCPGPVQTPMTENRMRTAADPDALRREYAGLTRLGHGWASPSRSPAW